MKISFVVLTWNSESQIKRCLETIVENIPRTYLPYEIFIVDNGSIDNSVKIIERFKKQQPDIINLICLENNRGTTFSRNLALRRAKGKYLVVMDSDVELSPGVIEKLIDVLEQDNRNGMVVPKLKYANGNLQKSTDNFPTIFTKIRRYFFLKFIEKNQEPSEQSGPYPVEYAISAFWLFRHDLLNEVGLLDENIFYAPEDVDYCLRIWKKGFRVIYVPEVSSIHHAQEISRNLRINSATVEHIKGLIYFFRKHKYFLKRPVLTVNNTA